MAVWYRASLWHHHGLLSEVEVEKETTHFLHIRGENGKTAKTADRVWYFRNRIEAKHKLITYYTNKISDSNREIEYAESKLKELEKI